jgi:hypothetical protein
MIIADVRELMRPSTRRGFVRSLLAGGSVLMLPTVFAACDDDDDPTGPGGTPAPVTGLSFDLTTDVGIFRLLHVQEQLEVAFYTAVVGSANFNSFFNADEREVLTDIRDVEVIHREFVRTTLGAQAVPDLSGSLNTTTLNTLLSSRANILNAARTFETIGVAALNGAGKYLQDGRNLLVAGKVASVEGRHLAALRDFAPPTGVNANTAFAGDDVIDGNGRDVKLEAGVVVTKVASLNVLMPATLATPTITAAPTATQGVATPDFFPVNP